MLLFDPRGEGDSEGDPNPLSWGGERDLAAAVTFLQSRPDVDDDRIGGLGLSVGGEGAGIRSVREHMVDTGLNKWAELPFMVAITASAAVFTNHTPPPSLERLIGEISPRPILLIYATNGQGGEHLNPRYLAAAGESASIWEITDDRHMGGLGTCPAEYEQRVVGFFDEHL